MASRIDAISPANLLARHGKLILPADAVSPRVPSGALLPDGSKILDKR